MRDANITYLNVTYDSEFAQSCCEVALRGLVKPEIVQSPEFQYNLNTAVALTSFTYGHLVNVSTRQWICLYSAV